MSDCDNNETLGQQIHSFFRSSEGFIREVRDGEYKREIEEVMGWDGNLEILLTGLHARMQYEFDSVKLAWYREIKPVLRKRRRSWKEYQ